MLGKSTFNQALKRNVTIFKWTLSLVKCLEVHLTLTKSILGRNDHLLHVTCLDYMSYYMSWPHVMMSWPCYNWPQQVSQAGVKLFFAWILMLSPYFRYCFHFRDWIFAEFYFYHFYVLTGYWNVIWVLKCWVRQRREIKALHQFASLFIYYCFFFHKETSF